MRDEDLEKAYPHVDDEGRRYRLIGGGAAAPRDYYVPGTPLLSVSQAASVTAHPYEGAAISAARFVLPSAEMSLTEDESTVDLVALASQRSISKIKLGELEKSCVVVPAKADGDCGFHATHLSLELQGKADSASQLNRESFIRLVSTRYNNPSLEPEIRAHIESIFSTDGARDGVDWQTRFKNRGYWLQEAHFKFLSRQFNLHFNFYYLDGTSHQFVSEPSYESIYTGKEVDSATIVSLAHVSTQLKDKHDASLNHFDAIIIEPTETQAKHIARIMGTETKHSTSAISFESAAIPSPAVSAVVTRSSRESLMMQLKELHWLETLNGLGALIPEAARPSCFISYAWGDRPSEKRVHELAMDLKCAGIEAVIDIIHNRDGSIDAFTEQVLKTDSVLVVGTPELKYKWEKRVGHVVPQELDLIGGRTRSRAQHQVIRVLLRESPETSFPDFMRPILPIIDLTSDISIEEEVLRLLDFLYLVKVTDPKESHYIKLQEEIEHWRKLKLELATLSEATLETQLKAYTEKHGEALKAKKNLKEHHAAEAAITRRLRATEEAHAELSAWAPPDVNPYFTGRESQLIELADMLQKKQRGIIGQSIAGLGGVGKTELAIEYANRALNKEKIAEVQLNYDEVFWIHAQNPSFSLRSLGRDLKLPVDDYKDNGDLMRLIYAHLASRYKSWLMILDDVESYEAIKDYLPQSAYSQCHILITSRSREWSVTRIRSVLLEGFSRAEAKEYINKWEWLSKESDEAKDHLAALVHDFPLALAQAIAYIDHYKLSIEDYITSYQTHDETQQALLEYEAPLLSGELKEDARKRAVYTTWHLSIKKLTSDPATKAAGELAEKLLSLSAYLLSHDIPIAFLEKLLGCSRLELGVALNLLSQHSLIQLDGSESYGMHQLLQEVIRLHEYKREESLILPLITQFETKLKSDAYAVIKEQERLFKHLDHLLTYVVNKESLSHQSDAHDVIKEQSGLFKYLDYLLSYVMNKKSPSHRLDNLLSIIGRVAEIHQRLGSYEALLKAKAYYEFLLKSNKEKTGSDEEIDSARILHNLALVFDALGDVVKKKELLEKALRIKIAHYKTEEHVDVASTLHNLANAVGALGDVVKQKKLLEKALRIMIAHYKTEEHVEVARTLANLAIAVGALGDVVKKKELLEKVLRIQIAHYKTEEHAEVATTQFNLAQAYSGLNDYTAALNLMKKAYAGFNRGYGESHPHTQLAKKRIVELSSLISSAVARGGAGLFSGTSAASHAVSSATLAVASASTATHSSALETVLAKYQLSKESALPTPEKALRRAAAKTVLDDVKFLLTQVRNINEADETPGSQRTALHWAIINGHKVVADVLLTAGASIVITDAKGKTVMHYVEESNNSEIHTMFQGRAEWLDYIVESSLLRLGIP